MGDVPSKRVNRRNAMQRSNAALRLRKARPGLPAPSAAPSAAELATTVAEQVTAAEQPLTARHCDSEESANSLPQVVAGDLADVVGSRLSQMRDQLLQELQASFAGLRADQAVAWSEQTALLKSLSEELTTGLLVESAQAPQLRSSERPLSPPQQVSPPSVSSPPQAFSPPQQRSAQTPLVSQAETAASGTSDALSRWEAIRQNFLQTDGKDLVEALDSTTDERSDRGRRPQAGSSPVAVSLEAAMRNAAELSDSEFADVLPEPLDPDQIPDSELRSVFVSRELLLAELIGRYRRRREHHQQLLSAEQLRGLNEQLPSELETLVTASLRRIDELTRLSELELAFERARLSRERKHLEQSRFLLENQARQLGLTVNSDGTLSRTDELGGRQSGRRWLGKLGFGGTNGPGR